MVFCDLKITEMEEKYLETEETVKMKEAEMKYAALQARIAGQKQNMLKPLESKNLYKRLHELQEQLIKTKKQLEHATTEIEVQRTILETYRMLVKLEETMQ